MRKPGATVFSANLCLFGEGHFCGSKEIPFYGKSKKMFKGTNPISFHYFFLQPIQGFGIMGKDRQFALQKTTQNPVKTKMLKEVVILLEKYFYHSLVRKGGLGFCKELKHLQGKTFQDGMAEVFLIQKRKGGVFLPHFLEELKPHLVRVVNDMVQMNNQFAFHITKIVVNVRYYISCLIGYGTEENNRTRVEDLDNAIVENHE